jgi:hypothetical protein
MPAAWMNESMDGSWAVNASNAESVPSVEEEVHFPGNDFGALDSRLVGSESGVDPNSSIARETSNDFGSNRS